MNGRVMATEGLEAYGRARNHCHQWKKVLTVWLFAFNSPQGGENDAFFIDRGDLGQKVSGLGRGLCNDMR